MYDDINVVIQTHHLQIFPKQQTFVIKRKFVGLEKFAISVSIVHTLKGLKFVSWLCSIMENVRFLYLYSEYKEISLFSFNYMIIPRFSISIYVIRKINLPIPNELKLSLPFVV